MPKISSSPPYGEEEREGRNIESPQNKYLVRFFIWVQYILGISHRPLQTATGAFFI